MVVPDVPGGVDVGMVRVSALHADVAAFDTGPLVRVVTSVAFLGGVSGVDPHDINAVALAFVLKLRLELVKAPVTEPGVQLPAPAPGTYASEILQDICGDVGIIGKPLGYAVVDIRRQLPLAQGQGLALDN